MKEISDKLAHEILDMLDNIERVCDEKAKEGRPRKFDVDADWMLAGCLCSELRAHVFYHMRDMIKHPAFKGEEK